jgi:DNA-directed RNA polymerase specialized sigma24 family protein
MHHAVAAAQEIAEERLASAPERQRGAVTEREVTVTAEDIAERLKGFWSDLPFAEAEPDVDRARTALAAAREQGLIPSEVG